MPGGGQQLVLWFRAFAAVDGVLGGAARSNGPLWVSPSWSAQMAMALLSFARGAFNAVCSQAYIMTCAVTRLRLRLEAEAFPGSPKDAFPDTLHDCMKALTQRQASTIE